MEIERERQREREKRERERERERDMSGKKLKERSSKQAVRQRKKAGTLDYSLERD